MSEQFNDNFNQETNEENFSSFNDENTYHTSDSRFYAEQKIELNNYEPSDPKQDKKGIRIFCILLVLALAVSGCAVGGFFLGRYTQEKVKGEYSDQTLINKPDGADDGIGAEIYNSVSDSLVTICVYNIDGNQQVVTGMVYSEDGYIVTLDSVYLTVPAAKFKVFTADGNEYDATFVGGDSRTDISVIKIDEDVKLSPISLGNSDQTVSGEKVFGISCPNGQFEKPLISEGIVSASYIRVSNPETSYSVNMIQTTVNANQGDYGGALVNAYGHVIGMMTMAKTAYYNYNGYQVPVEFDDSICAIPSTTLKFIAEAIIKDGKAPDRARIGISYIVKNSVDVEIEKLAAAGIMITSVDENSELYGHIKEKDIITKINGVRTLTDNTVLDIIEALKPGDTISVTVVDSEGNEAVYEAKLLNYRSESSYTLLPEADTEDPNGGLIPF